MPVIRLALPILRHPGLAWLSASTLCDQTNMPLWPPTGRQIEPVTVTGRNSAVWPQGTSHQRPIAAPSKSSPTNPATASPRQAPPHDDAANGQAPRATTCDSRPSPSARHRILKLPGRRFQALKRSFIFPKNLILPISQSQPENAAF